MRDLTRKQFIDACAKHGFKPTGFMGYFEIENGIYIHPENAGANRRAQLAYLIREQKRHAAQRKD